MDDRGVLILGCPRSGTTLLRRVFDAHPRFACPGETAVFRGAVRMLAEEPLARGVRFGVGPGLELAGLPADRARADLRDLAFGWMRALADRAGKPRWAEKTAVASFHAPALRAWLGGAVRYVVVLRHGLDVAASLAEFGDRAGGWLAELHRYVAAEPRPLVAMTRAWADCTSALLDLAQEPDVVVVRYEELVVDPDRVLAGLFAGLGEEWDPAWRDAALRGPATPGFGDPKTWDRLGIDASSVGRWRRIDPGTLADLTPLADPVLARGGWGAVGPIVADARRVTLAHQLAALKADRR